jgi:hypothetical protein
MLNEMDTENKSTTPDADDTSTPVAPTQDVKPQSGQGGPPTDDDAMTAKSLDSSAGEAVLDQSAPSEPPSVSQPQKKGVPWLLFVVLAAVIGMVLGFALGAGNTKAPVKSEEAPTPTIAMKKEVFSRLTGSVKTDTHDFDYITVDVSAYSGVIATKHESRFILDPQSDIDYPYVFEKLDPKTTYTVVTQGCVQSGQVHRCVVSKKVVNCSGRIPRGTQQCLINGDGSADFFLDKNLLGEVGKTSTDAPSPTPSTQPTTPAL